MALIKCSTCKGSGQVRNPNRQPKNTPDAKGPKKKDLDDGSRKQLKAKN